MRRRRYDILLVNASSKRKNWEEDGKIDIPNVKIRSKSLQSALDASEKG